MRSATTLKHSKTVHLSGWMFLLGAAVGGAWSNSSAQLSGPPAGVPVPAVTAPSLPARPAAAPVAAEATVFRVRLLNGRNGLPLEKAHVRLWYDEAGSGGYSLTTSSNGTALMPEPVGLPLRVLLAPEDKIDCRRFNTGDPAPGYNLQQIAEKGTVLQNSCGSVPVKARPGELVLFVRAPHWYENINRP